MARIWYGGGAAEYFANADGSPNPDGTAPCFDALSAGTQLTDLLDASLAATTVVTADERGGFRFQAPDGVTSTLYLEDDRGVRFAVQPQDIGTRVATNTAAITEEVTATTGDRDVAIAAAVADAVDSVSGDAADDLAAHAGASSGNPHADAGMAQGMKIGVGLSPIVIWNAATEPQASDGAQDDHFRFNTGA